MIIQITEHFWAISWIFQKYFKEDFVPVAVMKKKCIDYLILSETKLAKWDQEGHCVMWHFMWDF